MDRARTGRAVRGCRGAGSLIWKGWPTPAAAAAAFVGQCTTCTSDKWYRRVFQSYQELLSPLVELTKKPEWKRKPVEFAEPTHCAARERLPTRPPPRLRNLSPSGFGDPLRALAHLAQPKEPRSLSLGL